MEGFSVEDAARLLEGSLAALEWVTERVPEELHHYAPRALSGEEKWGVAMNLAHLAAYEERLAAPVLEALAAGGDGTQAVPSGSEDWLKSDAERLSEQPLTAILDRLRPARARQVEAVRSFDDESFNRPVTPLWRRTGSDLDSAGWVAAKTIQHTWEHGNTIFQILLFVPR